MSTYSIKDLEHLSGIKAHTLRMWEQRYALLTPERTGGNNERYYSNDDMRHLLNVSLLNRSGFKISRIAEMKRRDVENEVIRLTDGDQTYDVQIDALIVTMAEMDEVRFEKLFNKALLQHGFEQTILQVIFPFMRKIGIMWQVGSIVPAQEHFISNLVRQKIIVAIDQTEFNPQADSKTALLFLPEGELHELSLLFTHYLFKSHHHRVIYLGQNVPFSDLKSVVETTKPDYIFSVFTSAPKEHELQEYIGRLKIGFDEQTIILAGFQLQDKNVLSDKRLVVMKDLEMTIQFIEQLG